MSRFDNNCTLLEPDSRTAQVEDWKRTNDSATRQHSNEAIQSARSYDLDFRKLHSYAVVPSFRAAESNSATITTQMFGMKPGIPKESKSKRTHKITSIFSRITQFSEDQHIAFVTSVDETTKEHFEAHCDIDRLRENGIPIKIDSEFRCAVEQIDNAVVARLVPVPPKTISPDDMEAIMRDIEVRLSED